VPLHHGGHNAGSPSFDQVRFRNGYLKFNNGRPIAFVKREIWPDLLYAVLGITNQYLRTAPGAFFDHSHPEPLPQPPGRDEPSQRKSITADDVRHHGEKTVIALTY